MIHSWLNGTLVSYCDSDDIREVDFSQCYLTNEDYDILGLFFAKEYNQYWAHSSHVSSKVTDKDFSHHFMMHYTSCQGITNL